MANFANRAIQIKRRRKYLSMLASGALPNGVSAVLWRMLFTDDVTAPYGGDYTEPNDPLSVGILVPTEVDGEFSNSGGSQVIPAQATPTWGDQGWIGQDDNGDGFARSPGLAVILPSTIGNEKYFVGFGDGTGVSFADLADDKSALYFDLSNVLALLTLAGGVLQVGVWVAATKYDCVIISRSTGYFALLNNELLYVNDVGIAATLYPLLGNQTGVATMPTALLAQLITDNPLVYPVPQLSDAFWDVPPIIDGGGNGINSVANNVGLGTDAGADGYVFDGESSFIQLDAEGTNGMEANGWDEDEGSIIVELAPAVDDVGATIKYSFGFGVDVDNRTGVFQFNDTLNAAYVAGGTSESQVLVNPIVAGTTYRIGIQWTGGSVRFYVNGAESGAAQAIAGMWVGTLLDVRCVIGAFVATPSNVWLGQAHAFVATLNLAIAHADMLALTNQTTNPTLTPAIITAATGGDSTKWMGHFGTERYLADGRGHVEGQREGQVATAEVSGALATTDQVLSEAGDGIMDADNWTTTFDPILTNFVEDNQVVLRVARDSSNNPNIKQTVLTVGQSAVAMGEVRSDGNATGSVSSGPGSIFNVSNSTDWQRFAVPFIAGSVNVAYQTTTSTGNEYLEWRNLKVTELGASAFAATYHNAPLNDTADGAVFGGDNKPGFVQLPAAEIQGAGWDDAAGAVVCEFSYSDDTPASNEVIFVIGVDGNNRIFAYKATTAGRVVIDYNAGATTESFTINGLIIDTVYRIGILFTGGNASVYIDGAQSGGAQAIDGTWVGTLLNASCVIGALTNAPGSPFPGTVTAAIITLGVAPSDAQMIALTTQSNALTTTFLDAQIGEGDYVPYSLDEPPIGAGIGDGRGLLHGPWSIADGIAHVSPAHDPNLFRAGLGEYTSGTESWVAAGSNQITSVGGELRITYVNDPEGAQLNLNAAADLSADLEVGQWYSLELEARVTSGLSVNIHVDDGIENEIEATVTETSLTAYNLHFLAKHTTDVFIHVDNMSAGKKIWFDNLVLQKLSWSDLITCDPDLSDDFAYIRSAVVIDDLFHGGVALRVDDHTNPTTAVLVWIDEAHGAGGEDIEVWDLATNAKIAGWAITYNFGAKLDVTYRSDGKVWIFYDNDFIGNVAYTPGANAWQHGLFGIGSPGGESASVEYNAIDNQEYGQLLP